MTHIISAFPCLGKTTLYLLNKDTIFDRDFNESRSTKGMTPRQKGFFWYAASDLINVQADTDAFSYIFVTDELELLEWLKRPNLYTKAHDLTVILPDNHDAEYMAEYKKRIIERSGIEWFNRVMIPKLETLDDLMKKFQEKRFDVRLTNSNQPYIEDVFKFTDNIILPKRIDSSSRPKIVDPTQINYAELMLDVVNQTDKENWDYFSEDNSQIANEFLDYGKFSRVISKNENGKEIAVAYIQLRLLKEQGPQLLYKDLYHLAGLNGVSLWEKSKYSSRDLPIYIDVIAIKKEFQNQLDLLKLVPQALSEIVEDIDLTIPDIAFGKVFAAGVTKQGRKMCNLLKMNKYSEIERVESGISHTRTLYYSERNEFKNNLNSITKK